MTTDRIGDPARERGPPIAADALCPDCGVPLSRVGGCASCRSCGFSACG